MQTARFRDPEKGARRLAPSVIPVAPARDPFFGTSAPGVERRAVFPVMVRTENRTGQVLQFGSFYEKVRRTRFFDFAAPGCSNQKDERCDQLGGCSRLLWSRNVEYGCSALPCAGTFALSKCLPGRCCSASFSLFPRPGSDGVSFSPWRKEARPAAAT